MKQFTNAEQTAKLIELGLDTPRNFFESLAFADKSRCAYSIGELMEMLPMAIDKNKLEIWTPATWDEWGISYGWHEYDEYHYLLHSANKELIDALYDMILKLKEEGVI